MTTQILWLRRKLVSSSVRPLMWGRQVKSKAVLDESAHLKTKNITTNFSSGEVIACVGGFFFKIFEIINRGLPLGCCKKYAHESCLLSCLKVAYNRRAFDQRATFQPTCPHCRTKLVLYNHWLLRHPLHVYVLQNFQLLLCCALSRDWMHNLQE